MCEAIHVLKKALLQLREAPYHEVAAACALPADADARDRKRMGNEPLVDLLLHVLERMDDLRRIRSDDEEFACGIDDLACARKLERIKHAQRGQF